MPGQLIFVFARKNYQTIQVNNSPKKTCWFTVKVEAPNCIFIAEVIFFKTIFCSSIDSTVCSFALVKIDSQVSNSYMLPAKFDVPNSLTLRNISC